MNPAKHQIKTVCVRNKSQVWSKGVQGEHIFFVINILICQKSYEGEKTIAQYCIGQKKKSF